MIFHIKRYFIFFLTVFILFSCSLFDSKETEVTFHIPELPAQMQLLNVTGWRVEVTTVDDRKEFTTQNNTFKTSVPVSGITAVLAYPMGSWGTLKPAGFIVHGNLKAHNHLTWEDGFSSECTSLALAAGAGSENFNFTLFQQKLLEKSDGNPWILNRDKAVYGLSYGIFSMNYTIGTLVEFDITHSTIIVLILLQFIVQRSPIAQIAPAKISGMGIYQTIL